MSGSSGWLQTGDLTRRRPWQRQHPDTPGKSTQLCVEIAAFPTQQAADDLTDKRVVSHLLGHKRLRFRSIPTRSNPDLSGFFRQCRACVCGWMRCSRPCRTRHHGGPGAAMGGGHARPSVACGRGVLRQARRGWRRWLLSIRLDRRSPMHAGQIHPEPTSSAQSVSLRTCRSDRWAQPDCG